MPDAVKDRVKLILKLAEDIFNAVPMTIPKEWISSDLTLAQLRVLLVLFTQGPSRMSAISSVLGIAMPTATGIMDKLVKKKYVVRESDPQDRRAVICRLSGQGRHIVSRIWLTAQFDLRKLLDGMTAEQLDKIGDAVGILFDNVLLQTGKVAEGGAE